MELLTKWGLCQDHDVNEHEAEPATPEAESPVRAIARAARLLQAIAARGQDGAMLVDLSKDSGLGRATTHRLLAALSDVGYVFQDLSSKRYRLGSAITALGRHAASQEIAALAQSALDRVAAETGDTVYVSAPEGPAAICLGRATGAFPIRTLTLDVGDRRPLGVGGGSLALLAGMSDAHVERALARNAEWLHAFPGYTPELLRELVAETRKLGYALNQGRVVPGMSSVGVAVRGKSGAPIASLSIAAIADRLHGDRVALLVGLLRREAEVLERALAR
jgi:DNA-binding IclR family transcriptional regulator